LEQSCLKFRKWHYIRYLISNYYRLLAESEPVLIKLRTRFVKSNLLSGISYLLVAMAFGLGIAGCSQYNTGSGSVAYHNLTAKYNAYYLARTDLNEAEATMMKAYRDDYNVMVPILSPFDSNLALPVKPLLQDAIKKASIVAERHQNSKWLDNSYTVIGKSRLYLGQWDDGVEALRYVFAKGRDEDDKNTALIWLMRAYIDKKDFSNALSVAEYLREQPLTKEATRDFYITKAYLHQQNGEYLTAVAILEQTLSLMKKSPDRARLYFVAGQLYDRLGQFALANGKYKEVDKNRALYDLTFFAKMNSLQNKVLLDPKVDLSGVGFERLLRDRKNVDLNDRIYYTMGLLSERRGKYTEALGYLQKSVAVAGTNKTQIPYTYLELARIHYDHLEDYESAKAYFDSTLRVLPKEVEVYPQVAERKSALDEFVKYLSIIRDEDSLQGLAQLNPLAIDKRLDEFIEKEQAENALLLQRQQEAAQAGPSAADIGTAFISGNGARWELYDPSLVTQGKSEFRRVWGNRKLEDDWRRASKDNRGETGNGSQLAQTIEGNRVTPQIGEAGTAEETLAMTKDSPAWVSRRDALRANLPLTPDKLEESQRRKEEALYSLGKIYRFELKESEKAYSTFKRLLSEYPSTSYKEEIYYLNYLSLADGDSEKALWKDRLINEFPNSTYARLVSKTVGPDSGLAGAGGSALKTYEAIYRLYESGDYKKGLSEVEVALSQFHGNDMEDKFALLRIFLIGKVRGKEHYVQAVNEFLHLYPKSQYLPRVKEISEVAGQSAKRK
jgi:tetratricopeptide (TPR) repeat protein